ncbi:MAG: universal stress protein [Chloroflexota bacterium]
MNNYRLHSALDDFHAARSRAALKEALARFTGQPVGLLSYEEVRQRLKAQAGAERGLYDIPLAAIVGSVNRYEDFTRDFLPRDTIQGKRWASVKVAAEEMIGLPPIEVYQIGEAYFVKDGNHRVSVARQRGDDTIQAYVTEVKTAVPLEPDDSPDTIILKGEYANFLAATCFDTLRPQAALQVTAPGQYQAIQEHIDVHRYYMGIDFGRDVPLEEAVTHWYDTVYLPVTRLIRQRGLLQDFPGRTEADLYLWLAEHRAILESHLGMEVSPEAAAEDLAVAHSPRPERVVARLSEGLLEAVTPNGLESGPPVGQWRRMKSGKGDGERLFDHILVPMSTEAPSTSALEQALVLARLDGSRLNGLHVVPDEPSKQSPAALRLKESFERRCREENIPGNLAFASGEQITQEIYERSRWNDLVLIALSHPPARQALPRLGSGIRQLLQRSPTPVMTVPTNRSHLLTVSSLTHALLAYDGSPKAGEALYLAAYLTRQWQVALSVVTFCGQGRTAEAEQATSLAYAQAYLNRHGIQAEMIEASGPAATAILLTAETSHCDLILMGSYGRSGLVTAFVDDVVDQVLREANRPVVLCR